MYQVGDQTRSISLQLLAFDDLNMQHARHTLCIHHSGRQLVIKKYTAIMATNDNTQFLF